MPISEPKVWTIARRQRMQAQFPVLSQADPGTTLSVDNLRVSQGQEPSDFSMTALRLAAVAAESVRKPE